MKRFWRNVTVLQKNESALFITLEIISKRGFREMLPYSKHQGANE